MGNSRLDEEGVNWPPCITNHHHSPVAISVECTLRASRPLVPGWPQHRKLAEFFKLVLCLGTYILNRVTNSNKLIYISDEEEDTYFKSAIKFELNLKLRESISIPYMVYQQYGIPTILYWTIWCWHTFFHIHNHTLVHRFCALIHVSPGYDYVELVYQNNSNLKIRFLNQCINSSFRGKSFINKWY